MTRPVGRRIEVSILCSDTSLRAICDDMCHDNVPVGMSKASSPYMCALKRSARNDTLHQLLWIP